ncbi:MAG: hypothetical protein ACOX1I_04825 [Dethiobacteria bacterium]
MWKTGKRLSDYVGILFSGATCAISLGQVYGFLGKLINSKVFNIATKELIIMSKKFGKTWMFIAWLALAVFIYYNAQHEPQVVDPIITYPEIERPTFEEPINRYPIMEQQ